MRSTIACLFVPILLSGCAAQGTIVEKRSRLRPDSGMIGTEGVNSFVFRGPAGTSRQPVAVSDPQFWIATGGSFKFILRDRNGNIHSQLVTPEVFARYNVGDYFNDLLPPVETRSSKESATKQAALRRHTTAPQRQLARHHRSHRRFARHHHRQKPRITKQGALRHQTRLQTSG